MGQAIGDRAHLPRLAKCPHWSVARLVAEDMFALPTLSSEPRAATAGSRPKTSFASSKELDPGKGTSVAMEARIKEMLGSAVQAATFELPAVPAAHTRIRKEFLLAIRVGAASDVIKFVHNPVIAGIDQPDQVCTCSLPLALLITPLIVQIIIISNCCW